MRLQQAAHVGMAGEDQFDRAPHDGVPHGRVGGDDLAGRQAVGQQVPEQIGHPAGPLGQRVEVFDALQRLRLRYQLLQHADGTRPTDTVAMTLMSPIDRSVIGQAVREIAAAQRRMANVSAYVSTDEWIRPG